jgi:hypothetical protein
MAGIESIVRPFVRPDSLATRRIIASSEKIEVDAATITWGKAGTIAAAHQIDAIDETGTSFTVDLIDEEYTEDRGKRLTDVRRITQTLPDGTTNPDNFIDLDRPYQVTFEKVELDGKRPNETQVWSTSIETAGFSTVNPANKKGRSKFNLDRNLA